VTGKPVVLREQASVDIDAAVAFYLGEGGAQAASGFVDELEQALLHIGSHPASGSSRYAHELNLTGLRSWPLARYPYLVFYLEHPGQVDVWRVLHGKRDIPAWMREDEAP
jgi:toxin ParE1/3/4